MNRERAERAIRGAEREFRSAASCLRDGDYVGALKYLQESLEYAVKAVLIAYGIEYPKVHEVGRFLYDLRERFPQWFQEELDAVAEVTDILARGRPRFRYPYEYPPEEDETMAKEISPEAEKALENCRRLIKELFG